MDKCACLVFGVLSILAGECFSYTVKFETDHELDGYSCPLGDLIFSASNTSSEIDCVRFCNRFPGCNSLFYTQEGGTHVCNGCSSNYTLAHAGMLQSLPGSIYHKFLVDTAVCTDCLFQWFSSAYYITATQGTFPFGKSQCALMGGYPVAVETEAENTFLLEQLNLLNPGDVWIGLYRAKNAVNYVWNNTGAIAMDAWFPYSSGEPHHDNTDENCIVSYQMYAYQWVDVVNRCYWTGAKTLCEKNL